MQSKANQDVHPQIVRLKLFSVVPCFEKYSTRKMFYVKGMQTLFTIVSINKCVLEKQICVIKHAMVLLGLKCAFGMQKNLPREVHAGEKISAVAFKD